VSLNAVLIGVGGFIVLAVLAYFVGKRFFGIGKQLGKIDQALSDTDAARQAEQDMADIMTERRETDVTKGRLDDGSF
jgi:hypothetical protein